MKQTGKFTTGRCFLSALFLCLGLCGCEDKALVLTKASSSESDFAESTYGKDTFIEESAAEHGSKAQASEQWLYVHVCGAVKNPGVVKVPAGSRACEALEAAGGFTEEASQSSVNLAALLQDGQQLIFPTLEEEEVIKKREEAKLSGVVNINTAGPEELCTLPGVGESRAMDIVTFREQNGDFKIPEDIMKVSGIKDSLYQKIRDRITVE